MKNTKRTQSGRSMIEMVGVLAVMGLITAGAFVLITTGMQSQKRSRIADEVSAIVTEMQSVDLTQLGTTASADGTSFLSELKLPTNSGMGNYTVWKNGSNGFYVGILNMSNKDCSALAMRDWANSSGDATCSGSDDAKTLQIPYVKMD